MIQLLAALALAPAGDPSIKLAQGTVITGSCSIVKRQYLFPSADFNKPSITIKGNNITVDFAGATLRGSEPTIEPDKRGGLGLLIEGNNIIVKNARISGYKIGLIARNAKGLKLINIDASYNWKQHLESNNERESGADWMSYHHNETDQWYRYGAGLYLRNCRDFEVKGCRVTGGQCGLMMTDSTGGKVWNNDFSFLSGVGIGMFRSSGNRIMHNKIDWCVRGFSYGVYNRGQDSAGILIFEQCCRNVFAYNSVTHGGDGFFLWAGQTTMDTAKGGSNDNLLFGNDFSHAPTNAIEATFSRNKFANNLLAENWHGVWGGYSFDNAIVGNVFYANGEGIAIEHGQRNRVAYNAFVRDAAGINSWMRPGKDGWGFSLGRDTSSRDGIIEWNLFEGETAQAIDLRGSAGFKIRGNLFKRNGQVLRLQNVAGLVFAGNRIIGPADPSLTPLLKGNVWKDGPGAPEAVMERSGRDKTDMPASLRDDIKRFDLPWNPWPSKPLLSPLVSSSIPKTEATKAEALLRKLAPAPLKGGQNPFIPKGTLRGRRYLIIDEWGPYDFKSPMAVPREVVRDPKTGQLTKTYEVLGPKGTWRIVKDANQSVVSGTTGTVPGKFSVALPSSGVSQVNLEIEYRGAETTDYRGIVAPAGSPVKFFVNDEQMSIDWTAKCYAYDPKTENPLGSETDWAKIIAREPVSVIKAPSIAWTGRPNGDVPPEYYAAVGEGVLDVKPGTYDIDFISDDGIRVWLDGKLIIADGWHHQGATLYRARAKLGGKHTLRFNYVQEDGYAALRVRVRPTAAEYLPSQ